jgi:hypothetical protein
VAAVEHGIELGEERLDLGPGAADYKYRFSDSEEHFDAVDVVPAGARTALTRAAVAARGIVRPLKRRAEQELAPALVAFGHRAKARARGTSGT